MRKSRHPLVCLSGVGISCRLVHDPHRFHLNMRIMFEASFLLVPQPFPLVSSSRWMVKRGELTAFVEDSGIFLKRTSRQQVYFLLFNDVFIVTRKKR